MARLVDAAILEAVHAATRISFDAEKVAKDRLKLLARLKGGGVRSMVDPINPALLGALLYVLPRCIDRTSPNGEKTRGIYSKTLTSAIGDGAYDQEGHRNAGFLQATTVGPYPKAMQYAWQFARLDSAHICGLTLESPSEEWGRLGPVAAETPADVRNRGVMERKKRGRHAPNESGGIIEEGEEELDTHELMEVTAEVMNGMQAEEDTESGDAAITD
jgi:hypothetical protein